MSLLHGPAKRWWYRHIYLKSPHWVAFRRSWWRAHPLACCAGCGDGRHPMDLHHLTYVRIRRELFSDVIPLHRACHRRWEMSHGYRR